MFLPNVLKATMQAVVQSSSSSQRCKFFILPSWHHIKGEWSHYLGWPQCWGEALASQLGWTVPWRGCPHPHVKGLQLRLGPSLPFFSGKASRTKRFLRRPKLLLSHPIQAILEISFGSKGTLPAPMWGCEQPFRCEQLYRSLQSS